MAEARSSAFADLGHLSGIGLQTTSHLPFGKDSRSRQFASPGNSHRLS